MRRFPHSQRVAPSCIHSGPGLGATDQKEGKCSSRSGAVTPRRVPPASGDLTTILASPDCLVMSREPAASPCRTEGDRAGGSGLAACGLAT